MEYEKIIGLVVLLAIVGGLVWFFGSRIKAKGKGEVDRIRDKYDV